MDKVCDVLDTTSLFQGLAHDIYDDFCAKSSFKIIWKGEVVVNEGDLCTGIGLILEGKVAVQKYSSSGEFTTLELLSAGDLFGEYLIFGTTRTYRNTLEAIANTKIVFVPREDLFEMILKSPGLLNNLLTILSDRIKANNRRINLLSQKTLRQKVASYLLELMDEELEKEGKTFQTQSKIISTPSVELPVSKEVVARLLAMPRPSFSRELISMEKDGLIKVSGRAIWLLNIKGLEGVLTEDDEEI